jgi:carbohydrate kinase (thermoresistant glucokinase family)
MIIVITGVSGSGKTTVGEALARALQWPFHDADDYHPPANIAKMAAGTPLRDEDRWPWLDAMANAMRDVEARGGNAVFACSALKEAYRQRLAQAGDVHFVFLHGDAATIAARLARRKHKYMPASLLASQFATLEPPHDALWVDIRQSVDEQVSRIRSALLGAAGEAAGSP